MALSDFVLDNKLKNDIDNLPTQNAERKTAELVELPKVEDVDLEDDKKTKPIDSNEGLEELGDDEKIEIENDIEGASYDSEKAQKRREVLAKQWGSIYNQVQGALSVYGYQYFASPTAKMQKQAYLMEKMAKGSLTAENQVELAKLNEDIENFKAKFEQFSNDAFIDKPDLEAVNESLADIMKAEDFEPSLPTLIATALATKPLINISKIAIAVAQK